MRAVRVSASTAVERDSICVAKRRVSDIGTQHSRVAVSIEVAAEPDSEEDGENAIGAFSRKAV